MSFYNAVSFPSLVSRVISAIHENLPWVRRQRIYEAERRAREERRRQDDLERDERNAERKRKRAEWFQTNRPLLYYNTIDGITAVLRPTDLEAVKADTDVARIDELWIHRMLLPARNTMLFVSKPGLEHLKQHGISCPRSWLSELHKLVEETNADLVRDEQIFVPWVNNSLLEFEEQDRLLGQAHLPGRGLRDQLIESQAPFELHSF